MAYDKPQALARPNNNQRQAPAGLPATVPDMLQQRGLTDPLYQVLKNVLYPAASSEMSIAMAIDYCKARNLDIMKKPVHIVPVWDSKRGCMVDTIWPGIAEVRTTAARTAQYAGNDPVQFGPAQSMSFEVWKWNDESRRKEKQKDVVVKFPESATVTVYRIVKGIRAPFTATVIWLETVSTTKDGTPNEMWKKRPYSQLAKCAEAAALRAAFPEEVGDMYVPEESHAPAVPHGFHDEFKPPQPERPIRQSRLDKLAEAVQGEDDDLPPPPPLPGEVMPPEPVSPSPAPAQATDGPPANDPRFSTDERDIM